MFVHANTCHTRPFCCMSLPHDSRFAKSYCPTMAVCIAVKTSRFVRWTAQVCCMCASQKLFKDVKVGTGEEEDDD